ncbi:hypothetical protein [Mycolicibacterium setense]|uniref:Uncharacterized protein n=1 Tax=Mycolicibacterium setense TaxID=431269 RepID=A0ABR4YWB5_9MYCO|nr:hypothetical protein [Mycolicibacterium setense]KHO21964.1 hypothetical protein QQ25_15950 [Mycolicibacterium setense]KHO26478.1 hypothetical protein QQ44_12420 [Mycolicibacterium setense]MCV7113839.1 hypothetical protein [Mycolicibacterium setense]OBB13943.1 hypothetical protein A5761_18325 [Mycolicibacterium setense]
MTTAGNFRSVTSRGDHQVDIAGVPWPTYKLIALAIGALVLVVVGVATMTAAPAVLSAAAAALVVWLGLGRASRSDQ